MKSVINNSNSLVTQRDWPVNVGRNISFRDAYPALFISRTIHERIFGDLSFPYPCDLGKTHAILMADCREAVNLRALHLESKRAFLLVLVQLRLHRLHKIRKAVSIHRSKKIRAEILLFAKISGYYRECESVLDTKHSISYIILQMGGWNVYAEQAMLNNIAYLNRGDDESHYRDVDFIHLHSNIRDLDLDVLKRMFDTEAFQAISNCCPVNKGFFVHLANFINVIYHQCPTMVLMTTLASFLTNLGVEFGEFFSDFDFTSGFAILQSSDAVEPDVSGFLESIYSSLENPGSTASSLGSLLGYMMIKPFSSGEDGWFMSRKTCDKFIDAAWDKLVFTTVGGGITWCCGVLVKFLDCGWNYFKTGTFASKLIKTPDIKNWFSESEVFVDKTLIVKSDHFLEEANTMSREKFRLGIQRLIDQGSVLVLSEKSKGKIPLISARLNGLKGVQKTFQITEANEKTRPKPFGVLIFGGSSIGKTMVTDDIFTTYHAVAHPDEPWDDSSVYTRNFFDAFWSQFTGQPYVRGDDIGAIRPQINQGADIQETVAVMNDAPFITPQAIAEDKGKYACRAEIVVVTTNIKNFNAPKVFATSAAALRRFPIVVSLYVKQEFNTLKNATQNEGATGSLSVDKLRAWKKINPNEEPNIYHYVCEKVVSTGHSTKVKRVPLGKFETKESFQRFIAQKVRDHMVELKEASLVKQHLKKPKCSCGILKANCSYHKYNPFDDITLQTIPSRVDNFYNRHLKLDWNIDLSQARAADISRYMKTDAAQNTSTLSKFVVKQVRYSTAYYSDSTGVDKYTAFVLEFWLRPWNMMFGPYLYNMPDNPSNYEFFTHFIAYWGFTIVYLSFFFSVVGLQNSFYFGSPGMRLPRMIADAVGNKFMWVPMTWTQDAASVFVSLVVNSWMWNGYKKWGALIVNNSYMGYKIVKLVGFKNALNIWQITNHKQRVRAVASREEEDLTIQQFYGKIAPHRKSILVAFVGLLAALKVFQIGKKLSDRKSNWGKLAEDTEDIEVMGFSTTVHVVDKPFVEEIPIPAKSSKDKWEVKELKQVVPKDDPKRAISRDQLNKKIQQNTQPIEVYDQYENMFDKNYHPRMGTATKYGPHIWVTNVHVAMTAFSTTMIAGSDMPTEYDFYICFSKPPGTKCTHIHHDIHVTHKNSAFTFTKEGVLDVFMFYDSMNPPTADLTKFLMKSYDFEGPAETQFINETNISSIYHSVPFEQSFLKGCQLENYVGGRRGIEAPNIPSVPGDSGSCVTIEVPGGGYAIYGVHFGAHGKEPLSHPLTIGTYRKLERMIKSKTPFGGNSSVKLNYNITGATRYARPLFEKESHVEYYGTLDGGRRNSRKKSKYVPSIWKTDVEEKFFPTEYAPIPKNNPKGDEWLCPYTHNYIARTQFKPTIDEFLLEKSADNFGDRFNGMDLSKLGTINLHDNLNGIDGEAFFDGIKRNTSAGYPYNKPKNQIFILDEKTDHVRLPVKILVELIECEEALARGESINSMFSANTKDEVLKLAKIKINKLRIFMASCLILTILLRKYFLRITQLFHTNIVRSEMAVGINTNSGQWKKLLLNMNRMSYHNYINGDFKGYDTCMSPQILTWAFRIMIKLAMRSGNFTERDIKIMWGLSDEVIFFFCAYDGELLKFIGTNPSGGALTVVLNGLINSLLNRICFYTLYPKGNFNLAVFLMTYGDDNILSVKDGFPQFNQIFISKILAKYGIVYTSTDKNSFEQAYTKREDLNFLKRRFVETQVDGQLVVLCPIELESMVKTMCYDKYTDHQTMAQYRGEKLSNLVMEGAQHGERVYGEMRTFADFLASKYGVPRSELKYKDLDWKHYLLAHGQLVSGL